MAVKPNDPKIFHDRVDLTPRSAEYKVRTVDAIRGGDMSTTYPLVFTFHEVIVGNGFVAKIDLNGRALWVEDKEEGSWLYGVEPGAIAGGGTDYPAACREFKKSYLSVLFDLALETQTFDDFKREVEAFTKAINLPNQKAWERALKEIRESGANLNGFARVKAENHPLAVEVSRLDPQTMQPGINKFDEVSVAEAA